MICARCGHPFDWHGDRAVAACDGGWDSKSITRHVPIGPNGRRPVSACGCTGWLMPRM